jgi:hypothetical protein
MKRVSGIVGKADDRSTPAIDAPPPALGLVQRRGYV